MRGAAPALLLLAAVTPACGTGHAARSSVAGERRSVRIERARVESRAVGEEVVGTVRARTSAVIAPTVMGRVQEVRVTLGSRVRAGDVLVRLSVGEIDARLEQARAVTAHARIEHERAGRLRAARAIPTAEYDDVAAKLHVAEAAEREAGTMAGHAVLRAPFAGVVTAKQVSVGDTAMPGKPLLVVEDPGALRFEAPVPETAARGVAPGRVMTVRLDGVPREVAATVVEVSPIADPASRTVLVKLDLPALPSVRSGLFGRLLLPSGEERVVVVPTGAVVRRGQLEEVFVIEEGVARLRLVRIGRERGGVAEVLSGLDGGEAIAVSDAARLVDGQPVQAAVPVAPTEPGRP